MKFEHAAALGSSDSGTKATIHLLSVDGTSAMCGQPKTFKIVRGIEVRVLYIMDEPANCKSCTKALEMVVRNDLARLNIAQLEEMGELAYKLRMNGS